MKAIHPKTPGLVQPLILAGLLLAANSVAHASTYSWAVASGNFSNAASWSGNNAAQSGSDTALIFNPALSTFAATADITGTFRLNSLALSGSTGSITVSSGTLSFAQNGTVNPTLVDTHAGNRITIGTTGSGKIAVETGANLTISGASVNGILLSGLVVGGGGITVDGATVSINNSNTFSGGMTLNSGYLSTTANALGTGTLTLKGGIFKSTSAASTATNAVVIAGDVQFGSKDAGNTITLSGATLLQGTGKNFQLTISGTNVTGTGMTANTPVVLAGAIGDGGGNNGLVISSTNAGTNVLVMSGSLSNTYTGTTLVKGVSTTLQLAKTNGAIAIAGDLNIAEGTVALAQSNQISTSSVVTVSGTGSTAAVLDLKGNNQTIGTLRTGGNLATSSALVSLGSGTLTLAGDYTYTAGSSLNGAVISGAGKLSLGTGDRTFNVGHVTGATADTTISTGVEGNGHTLTKTGNGILVLNGTSNVNADVQAGELGVNSQLNGNVSVAGAGTLVNKGTITGAVNVNGALKGSGTIDGTLHVSGAISPGEGIGTVTVTGGFTLESTARMIMEISGADAGFSDQILVGGNAILAGALDLTSLSGLTLGQQVVLLENTNKDATTTGFFSSILTTDGTFTISEPSSDYVFSVSGTSYKLAYGVGHGTDGALNDVTLSVVPEPATWGLLVGGLGILIAGRRFGERCPRI